jgi:hypothetical protein
MTFYCSARVKNQISDPVLSMIVFIAADAESLRIAKPLRRLLTTSSMLRLLSEAAEQSSASPRLANQKHAFPSASKFPKAFSSSGTIDASAKMFNEFNSQFPRRCS